MRILSYLLKPASLAVFALLVLVPPPAISQGIDLRGVVEGIANEIIRRETQGRQSSDQREPAQREGQSAERVPSQPVERVPAQQANPSAERFPSQTVQRAPTRQVNPSAVRSPAQTVDLRSIQQHLARLGYSPGVADGLMGPNTRRAIQKFQLDQGLAINGVASPQLLEKLRSVVAARQSGAAVAGSTPRPSFDCTRAGTPTESAICASPELAQLDRQMAEAYSTARADASNPSAVVNAQRNWISRRNACGGNAVCLAQTMQQRIQALDGSTDIASFSDTGVATGAILGQERIPAGVALEGGDAYSALLDRYIREHPDAARHPEFLPYFAGLGCLAQGWGRNQNLNPFELAEIESEAKVRLEREVVDAGSSPAGAPLLISFRANVTAGDYDMAKGVFPIISGRSIEANIRPDDHCQTVARAKDIRRQSVFPTYFWIAAADGAKLEPSHVVEMLGGTVAIGRERARTFYERGFPTIIVEVTGRVRSLTRAEDGVGLVLLEPVGATLRTQGNAQYSQELAVLGPEQIVSSGPVTEDMPDPAAMNRFPELSEAAFIAAALRDNPEILENPHVAAHYAYWDGERGCVPEADLRDKANPEFVRRDLLDEAPTRARQRLGSVPEVRRFSIVDEAKLQEYDLDARAFDLDLQYSNGRPDEQPQRFRYAISKRVNIPACVTRDGPGLPSPEILLIRDFGLLTRIPISPEEAEALVLGNPDRAVTVLMDVELEGFVREYGRITAANLMLHRGQVVDKASGEVLLEITAEEVEAARPEADRWSEIPEVTYRQMLVRLVRQHPALAAETAYVRAFMGETACNRLREAEGNPITMQRLRREFSAALEEEITGRGAQHIRLAYGRGGYGNVELGDYDLDAERFMFRFDQGTPFAESTYGLRTVCRVQSLSESPNEIRLELSGLRELLEGGLPMPLARAEEFLERYGGRKDGRERRVTVMVVATPGKMTPPGNPEQPEVVSGKLEAVALRVVDPLDSSVIHQAGTLPGEGRAETDPSAPVSDTAAETEPPGPAEQVSDADGAQEEAAAEEPLQLLGIRLGMSKDQARSALAGRFPADGIASLESDMLAAEEGPCLYHTVVEPGLAEEAGSACALVRFGEDDASKSVMVRNVVPGAQTKALTEMLASRFGPTEERVEASGTVILGWGVPLSSADELDRDLSAGQTPRTLEARISEAHSVTLVTLRLDADPAPGEPQQTTPGIKF